MKIIIIIPTYNEAMNVERICGEVLKAVPNADVLIVDDNSPDGTGSLALRLAQSEPRIKVLQRESKEGLGKAYLNAFEVLLADRRAEIVCMMDSDFSHDPESLPSLISACEKYDVAIGSRYMKGGGAVGWSLWRRLLSSGGNRYARLVTGMQVHDLTAGFYAIRADALRKLTPGDIDNSGYAFQIELKYAFFRSGARITEVPITFRERAGGESKLSGHIISEGIIAPWKLRLKK